MIDFDFEEFPSFNAFLPKQFTAPAYSYTLAHAITPLEENKSFLEKVELGERLCGIQENQSFILDRNSREDSNWTEKLHDRDKWRENGNLEESGSNYFNMENSIGARLRSGEDSFSSNDNQNTPRSRLLDLDPELSDTELASDISRSSGEETEEEVVNPDEVITSEDRDRILEMGRSMMDSIMEEEVEKNSPKEEIKEDEKKTKRRRRKLPDIPKNKKPLEGLRQTASLFDELSAATPSWESRSITDQASTSADPNAFRPTDHSINQLTRDILTSLTETPESSLPPSLLLHLVNIEKDEEGPADIDSGNSTSHSPEEVSKHHYREHGRELISPLSPSLTSVTNRLELLDPTHRGLHRFVPRHADEVEIEIGDPVYVQKEAEDLWCEGINLRTGKTGIFPEAHVVDVDYNDFDPAARDERKERYILDYLGSVRCAKQKGTGVIIQAVQKSLQSGLKTTCILEIGEKGIKMLDKTVAGDKVGGDSSHEYFFHLKNVTFCGFHPRDHKYFAFITKHPSPCVQEYACHVFVSETSTRCVAEAYGRAFHRFYKTFINTVFPTEDIYLE